MERTQERIVFHDPLYELGILRASQKSQLIQRLDPATQKRSELYREVLGSYELARMGLLRQSGLAFLVFPSSTHTRLAHALGTWTLGNFAVEHVEVESPPTREIPRTRGRKLGRWLEEMTTGWQEEFSLALLLHDIGHPPFSHVLESNAELEIDHEENTRNLILGQGEIYRLAEKRARELGVPTVHEVLNQYAKNTDVGVSIDIVANVLQGEGTDRKYWPLKELVHGVADLDRIDHYNRDSYFMGLKLANTNIKGLLENLILEYNDVGPGPIETTVCVLQAGEPHLLQLLFSRDLLWQSALDHDVVRSYEAVLNCAVSRAIGSGGLKREELLLMADDELLFRLREVAAVRPLVNRLLGRRPYTMCYRKEKAHGRAGVEAAVREVRRKLGMADEELVLHCSPGFGQRAKGEWLALCVRADDGTAIDVVSRNQSLFDFFRGQERKRQSVVRIYAIDEGKAEAARGLLEERLRGV